jgi:hypothetical protein
MGVINASWDIKFPFVGLNNGLFDTPGWKAQPEVECGSRPNHNPCHRRPNQRRARECVSIRYGKHTKAVTKEKEAEVTEGLAEGWQRRTAAFLQTLDRVQG